MKKSDLINELNDLILKFETEELTKGQVEILITKIQIIQSKIQSQYLIENNKTIETVVKNNKKASNNTVILSILAIILSIISLYNGFKPKDEVYKDEIDVIINQQQNTLKELNLINDNLLILQTKDSL